MSGEEWSGVKEQMERIVAEVVEYDCTKSVINSLCQRDVLTQGHVAHLRSLNTRKEQVRQLVALLAATGDSGGGGRGSSSNLSIFLEVLQEHGMENLVRCLDPSGAHSPNTLRQGTGTSSALRSTPYHHPPQKSGGGVDASTTLPGQLYPTLPQPDQPYSTLPQPGQPYPTIPWPSQPYSTFPWLSQSQPTLLQSHQPFPTLYQLDQPYPTLPQPGHPHSALSPPGQPYPTLPWVGQFHRTLPQPCQPYPTLPWLGQLYVTPPWPCQPHPSLPQPSQPHIIPPWPGQPHLTQLQPGQSYPTFHQQGQPHPTLPQPAKLHLTLPQPGQDVSNNKNDSSFNDNCIVNTNEDTHTTNTDTSASSPRSPLKISVVPCRDIGGKQFSRGEVYKNESEPRGYVFLANYKDFYVGQHKTRSGSEIDVKNLEKLFFQMGYKTSTYTNMTKQKTFQALRNFRNMEEHKKVDSCIVVFMSHGRDNTSFFTSDNLNFTVDEVVEYFNNRECPKLMGKPKIFIFQFCRGTKPDVGVIHAKDEVIIKCPLQAYCDSLERKPTFTDMYIVYSTVGGFASFRHPESGSWLVEAICEVFMKDACNTELEHLMKKVSTRVQANSSTKGNKQACEFVLKAFDRHFFFNPKPLASPEKQNSQKEDSRERERTPGPCDGNSWGGRRTKKQLP